MRPLSQARLYAILDTGCLDPAQFVDMARALVDGGADIIQVRAKGGTPDAIAALAERVHDITRPAGIPLIINDHPEVAQRIGCEGAHVGQDDLSVSEARARLGSASMLLGKSTHSPDQARAAAAERPDYLGFGPVFATPTKPDYRPIGLGDIRAVHDALPLPIFCIGGVNLDTARAVLDAGARRIVVVSALLKAAQPDRYCRELRALLDSQPLPSP